MPDLTDDIQELVQVFNDASLQKQLEAAKPPKPFDDGEGDVECEECGVIIPKDRRKASGSVLCVDCATYLEKSNKLRKMRGGW